MRLASNVLTIRLREATPYGERSQYISFKTQGGHTLVQVFDTLGRLLVTLVEKDYPTATTDKITFVAEGLPTGIYYARFQNGVKQAVWPMRKVRE